MARSGYPVPRFEGLNATKGVVSFSNSSSELLVGSVGQILN
jgi:hypothetical protein